MAQKSRKIGYLTTRHYITARRKIMVNTWLERIYVRILLSTNVLMWYDLIFSRGRFLKKGHMYHHPPHMNQGKNRARILVTYQIVKTCYYSQSVSMQVGLAAYIHRPYPSSLKFSRRSFFKDRFGPRLTDCVYVRERIVLLNSFFSNNLVVIITLDGAGNSNKTTSKLFSMYAKI